jgi:hypothetical protein
VGDSLGIRDVHFQAAVELAPHATLRLAGNADSSSSAGLAVLLDGLHARLLAAHAHDVVVDIRMLEFMNASCFNAIVSWLSMITELPPGERYLLKFESNTSIPWQRRSLRTLACFATDLVTVDA